MSDRNRETRLSLFHPFTARQAEIIEVAANEGADRQTIADSLHISPNTLKTHIHGDRTQRKSSASLGILGVIEERTGHRPASLRTAINQLQGDILFTRPRRRGNRRR
jgi:DNA-binding CsgD family transcriptional regulator